MRLWHALRTLCTPDLVAREIDAEMAQHLALETDDLIRQGLEPAEARRRALSSFGALAHHTQDAQEQWPLRPLARFIADLRLAARSLRRTPGFTTAALLALAIALGANWSVFGAVDSVAFRPLAVRHPEALVALYGTEGEANLQSFSYPAYEDLRRGRGGRAFSDIAVFTEAPVTVLVSGEGTAAAVWAMHTSDNYFSMLGVAPAHGAFYQPGDLTSPVVVLSHAFWTSALARDPHAVGRTLAINGHPFTIVAVAPAQFTGTRLFTYDPALWIPVGMHAQTLPASTGGGMLSRRDSRRFLMVGRLRDGVTLAEAEARTAGVRLVANARPINPWLAPPERVTLIGRLMLLGALIVVLIAAVNVSSLQFARMGEREQEIAIRRALGASRRRLLRQLLVESLVLAGLGALLAIPIHVLASRGLRALTPHLEYVSTWRPTDAPRLLAYGVLLTLAVALVCGLGPALRGSGGGRSFIAGLRDTAAGWSTRWTRFCELLVGTQAVVSMVLLVAGGLCVRSFQHARRMDPGFALDGAVAFTLDPVLSPAYDGARTLALYRRLDAGLAALPGVQSTARAAWLPLDGNGSARRVFTETMTDPTRAPVAELNVVTPRYFATIGTPIISGREFTEMDSAAATQRVVINDVLAQRLWPGESAIGHRLRIELLPTIHELEVVGVARTSRYRTLRERPRPAVWLNFDRYPHSRATTLVRTSGREPEAALVAQVSATVRALDATLPIMRLGTLRQHISVAYASAETGAVGALAFGMLALLLAASGVYGLTAFTVAQRRREIGIHMALGATRGAVLRLVAGRALALTLTGAGAGALFAAFAPIGLDPLLFEVPRYDLSVVALAIAVFAVVVCVAALSAARRAMTLDPIQALNLE